MTKLRLRFYGCDHEGDLLRHEDGLIALGAKVCELGSLDGESGTIDIEVSDPEAFKTALKTSEVNDFLSSMWGIK